jgi:hypothetical protein
MGLVPVISQSETECQYDRCERACGRVCRYCSVLWATLEQLPAAALAKPAGLAFDSIHGTLAHLLCADILWYHRLTKSQCTLGLSTEVISKLWGAPATGE